MWVYRFNTEVNKTEVGYYIIKDGNSVFIKINEYEGTSFQAIEMAKKFCHFLNGGN